MHGWTLNQTELSRKSGVQWHWDSIICYKVNPSLLKYQAFHLSNQQEVISLCESRQHKKTVVRQTAGLKALIPVLKTENSLGHTKISSWQQPTAEGRTLSRRQHLAWGYFCPIGSPGFSFTELLLPSSSAQAEQLCLAWKIHQKSRENSSAHCASKQDTLKPAALLTPHTRRNGEAHLTDTNPRAGGSWVILDPRKVQANGISPSGTAVWQNISRGNTIYLLLGFFGLGTMENWPFVCAGSHLRAPRRSATSPLLYCKRHELRSNFHIIDNCMKIQEFAYNMRFDYLALYVQRKPVTFLLLWRECGFS